MTFVSEINLTIGNEVIANLPGHASFYTDWFSNGRGGGRIKGKKVRKTLYNKIVLMYRTQSPEMRMSQGHQKDPEYLNIPHI